MYDRNSLQCDGNDVSNYYLKTHYYKIQKILLLLLLYLQHIIYNILFIFTYILSLDEKYERKEIKFEQ